MAVPVLQCTNGNLLGSTPDSRINKRRLILHDSQFSLDVQWRPSATFFSDPRVRLGFMQLPRGALTMPGQLNNAYGCFGIVAAGCTRTGVTQGEFFPSPNNAYTCDLPGGMQHDLYGSEPANFNLLNDQQRVYAGAASGEWLLGNSARIGGVVARLPGGYAMTSSGYNAWCAELDLSPTNDQAITCNVDFSSNGTTRPHNSTAIVESPTFTPTMPSGVYGMTYMGLWSVFGTELNKTVHDWYRFIRRCDASGNWIPNTFGALHFGAGGFRVEDFTEDGYDTGVYLRRFTDAAVLPILSWYQPTEVVIMLGQNGFFVGNEGAHMAALLSVIGRVRDWFPGGIVINLVTQWDATSNVATYNFATERLKYDGLYDIHEQIAQNNKDDVVHSPLNREVRARLGNPSSAGGNWLSTHLGDGIHLSQTGATDPVTALPRMLLDLWEKGGSSKLISIPPTPQVMVSRGLVSLRSPSANALSALALDRKSVV